MEPDTITVWAFRLKAIDEKIEKVNKKARKRGFAEIEYREVGRVPAMFDPCYSMNRDHLKIRGGTCRRAVQSEQVEIEVTTTEPIRIEGWTLVATLESFKSEESGEWATLVHAVPDQEVPYEFRDADFRRCDHCEKRLGRRQSFVITKDGEYRQIGKNCLADFLRTDPARIIWAASLVKLAKDTADDERWPRIPSAYSSLDLLIHVAQAVRVEGDWFSSQSDRATARTASALMFGPLTDADREWMAKYGSVTEADADQAVKWLEWIKAQTGDANEYIAKLRMTAIEKMWLEPRDYGIVASVPKAMQSDEERAAQREEWDRQRAERESLKGRSEWVGKAGERIEISGKVEFVKYIETRFGGSELIKIRTTEGNLLVWFSSSYPGVQEGDEVEGKATVKKHDEFNGEEQTVVTRAKLAAKAA